MPKSTFKLDFLYGETLTECRFTSNYLGHCKHTYFPCNLRTAPLIIIRNHYSKTLKPTHQCQELRR